MSGCAGGDRCDLKLTYGQRSQAPPQQFHVDLVLTDDGGACRLSGYPTVELIGPGVPIFGPTYVLPEQEDARVTTFTLRSGQSAHAVLTWLPSSLASSHWRPRTLDVVVKPRDGASSHIAIPWRYGDVLRQDAATHPGTYVGPLRAATG
jgi:hypothetical protein